MVDHLSTITACFNQHVTRAPNAVALVGDGMELSYLALNRHANRLAQQIREAGVTPGDRVAVCLPRSPIAVVAFLAVLKAGAAYVPLDPGYGDTVKASYVAACATRHAIVAADECASWAEGLTMVTASLQDIHDHTIAVEEIDLARDAEAPAYVMFTSGSMGQPKGVEIAHRGVVRLVRDTNYIAISEDDVFMLLSNIAFDASTFELWGALLNGAKLVVYSQPGFDPNAVIDLIRGQRVSILWLTAALFHLIARHEIDLLRGLRVLLAGGDVLRADAVNTALDAHPELTIVNGYGPTENTTFTCCHVMTCANRPGETVPIGRAITGTVVHILDRYGNPVINGQSGELCTSGLGVALGYVGTQQTLRPSFIARPDGKHYLTGDLVQCDPSGLLHYLGRCDRVVKIRGYRVSLDEIQDCLGRISGVQESLVQVGFDLNKEKRVEAFVQIQHHGENTVSLIKSEMRKLVPSFMVPDVLTICARLPLNANGKLDRKAIFNNQ